MQEFDDCFNKIWQNNAVQAVVLMSGKNNSFIAGADIKYNETLIIYIIYINRFIITNWIIYSMLSACKSPEEVTQLAQAGQEMLLRIEKSPKPIVAAVMGTCMGGGFEVAF